MRVQKKYKGLIFVVSGPSGSGKSTLLARLLRQKPIRQRLARAISFTTRPKRSGEKNGRDYFFISQKRFKLLQKAKKFIEWTRYLGYYYATPQDFIERQHKKSRHIILCLDLKGASEVRRIYPKNTITIFVLPPSLEALAERIKRRCHKTRKEEIQKRLRLAKQELLAGRRYNYCLVNKDLGEVTRQLKEIILNEISRR